MSNRSDGVPAFAKRLRRARRDRNIGQTALAGRTGVTSAHISRLEAGTANPSILTLVRIADELRVSTDYLLARVASRDMVRSSDHLARRLAILGERDDTISETFSTLFLDILERRTGLPIDGNSK